MADSLIDMLTRQIGSEKSAIVRRPAQAQFSIDASSPYRASTPGPAEHTRWRFSLNRESLPAASSFIRTASQTGHARESSTSRRLEMYTVKLYSVPVYMRPGRRWRALLAQARQLH